MRPLALGSLHGLVGSAAAALLALASIHSEAQTVLRLALFGMGTIAGMLAITGLLIIAPLQIGWLKLLGVMP